MRRVTFLVLLACAVPAAAEDPLSFAAILVEPEEIPEHVRLIQDIHTVAPHPRTFFDTPSVKDIAQRLPPEVRKQIPRKFFEGFPIPKRKESQSFESGAGAKGTVFLFEYATTDLSLVLEFLVPTLYGTEGRCAEHPEELVVRDRFLWIISFPRGDPAAEWYKLRLRKKLRVPAPRERLALMPLRAQLSAAQAAEDADTGLRLLKKNAEAVEDWAFGQNMLGQFASMKRNHKLAAKGFRKALELHEALVDPMEPPMVWTALDGLGLSLHRLGKRKEAVQMLQRALEAAQELGEDEQGSAARTRYNLARAYAKWRKYPDALRALREAIAEDAQFRERARTDSDFAAARRRKEFKTLLR